jgi:hypothetical protein
VTDAIDKVVCAPDDGWRNHPKKIYSSFQKYIKCVTLGLVGSEYTYDARTHEG